MANFTAGTSFTDGVTNDVTSLKLNALIADAVPTSNLSLNSTTGTIATFNSTTGTIATLNSTTGTITTGVIPTLTSTTLITTGTGTAAAPAIQPTGDTNTGIFFPAADTIAFSEGGAEAMRINASGSLLIGTTSDTSGGSIKLRISDGTIDSAYGYKAGGVEYVGTITSHPIAVLTNNAERLRIDSSGNVGIGVATPAVKLHVASGNMRLDDNQFILWGGNTNGIQGNNASNFLGFATNSTERLRIDSSGNVLVGTTSANPSGASSDGRIVINAANGGQSALTCYNLGTGATNIISLENGNGQVGRIQISGSATSYLTSSDYRLKENVQPMTGALARVASLKPCTFKWKIDGTDGQGFVAHELEEVCPDAVGGEKDAVNAQGGIEPQGIDQSKIVPLLTAALKEAIAKIETLEAKVTALEVA